MVGGRQPCGGGPAPSPVLTGHMGYSKGKGEQREATATT